MDATDRIVEEYSRLVSLGPDGRARLLLAEQVIFYVVYARCEKCINGFSSVYEQALNAEEIVVLEHGLDLIGEHELAAEFRRGFDLLKANGFYGHMNWNKVSESVNAEIEAIGERVGDQMLFLDDKLVALLDNSEV